MAKDAPGSTAGKSASPSQNASFADERSAEASEPRANRPIETRSGDEPISLVGIGAFAGGLESEMRFREFAENSADVFWIIDAANEKLEYLNRAYEHIWGEARGAVLMGGEDSQVQSWRRRRSNVAKLIWVEGISP